MGAKKSKGGGKKKGPKGKKARAKAKLEQVWGEHVDEDARKASKFRTGKSRLVVSENHSGAKQHNNNNKKNEKEVDPLSSNRRGIKSSFESFLERKDNLYQTEQQQKQHYKHHKKNKKYNTAADDESSDDDDDDDSGSEDKEMGGLDMNGAGSLSHLLKRINGPKKSSSRSKVAAESDDDDSNGHSDDDTESVSSTSSSSQQSHSDSDDDNMDMDDEGDDDVDLPEGTAEDPYEAHFSKQPLPQLDSKENTDLMPHLGKSSKVNTSSLLSSSMQVHLSGPILDSWETLTGSLPDKTKPKQMWRAFAGGPQQHTRQVLSRNWNNVNRSALKRNQRESSENENDITFSPLQQVLYPAISRYADVLISMESRQVSVYHPFSYSISAL